MTTIIYFDGGSRGNPGPSAGGAVIHHNGQTYKISQFLPHATVNEAEYSGCIIGLKKALEVGAKDIHVYGDSKLVIQQVSGAWTTSATNLIPFCNQAQSLARQFTNPKFEWIRRDRNKDADLVCNECMDLNTGITAIREKSLSLPVLPAITDLAQEIAAIIQLGDTANFKAFKNLKSGNDKFSRYKLPALIESVSADVWELVKNSVTEGEDWQAKALRWYMRGLPVNMAIHKIKVDWEISKNATKAKLKKWDGF